MKNLIICLICCCSLSVFSQDSLKMEDIQRFSYSFTIENGAFQGEGAKILKEAISNAHITMLGENAGSKLDHQFTETLIYELDKNGYKNMVLETGHATGPIINKLAKKGTPITENIKALNRKYHHNKSGRIFTPILDLKSVESAQYFEFATNKDWNFLTVGTDPWTSYKMLVDEMYSNLKPENKKEYQKLFEQTHAVLDKQYEQITAHNSDEVKVFIAGLKSDKSLNDFLDKMALYSDNEAIIQGMKYSLEYWEMYGNKKFYEKNMVSAHKDKLKLAKDLKGTNFDFKEDKLFVKMWRKHISKGHSVSGTYGVGSMLYEMADLHENKSLTIGIIRRYYKEDGSTKDMLETKDAFSKRYRKFVQLGKEDEWVVIDLRPFSKEFYYGPYAISTAVYKMMARYDMLVIPSSDEKATINY